MLRDIEIFHSLYHFDLENTTHLKNKCDRKTAIAWERSHLFLLFSYKKLANDFWRAKIQQCNAKF